MKIKYITIEREYGSGGNEIARRLAEKLGIPCYGREILEMVAKDQSLTVSEIDRYEESVTGSFLYSFYVLSRVSSSNTDMLTKEGHIFVAEQAAIKNLAKVGKCIFVGHCASEALKEEKNAISVFIRSGNEEEMRSRIMSEYGIDEKDVDRVKKKFDKKRSNYYYANTTRRWEDMKNYDIVLDSSAIGIDGCVKALSSLFDTNEK